MDLNDILYSINDYDSDGEITDEGVYLHFGQTRVKVAETLDEFRLVAEWISGMVDEISESYPEFGNGGAQ
jgi:hypothetical protein